MSLLECILYSLSCALFLTFTEFLYQVLDAYDRRLPYPRYPEMPWIIYKYGETYYRILCLYRMTLVVVPRCYKDYKTMLELKIYYLRRLRPYDIPRLLRNAAIYIFCLILREIGETLDTAVYVYHSTIIFIYRVYNFIVAIFIYFLEKILFTYFFTKGLCEMIYLWYIDRVNDYKYWSFEIKYQIKQYKKRKQEYKERVGDSKFLIFEIKYQITEYKKRKQEEKRTKAYIKIHEACLKKQDDELRKKSEYLREQEEKKTKAYLKEQEDKKIRDDLRKYEEYLKKLDAHLKDLEEVKK